MEDYSIVFYGYWGALACMITSMIMMSKTDQTYIESKQKNNIKCPNCNNMLSISKNFTGDAICTDCNNEFRVVSINGQSMAIDAREIPNAVKHME